MNSGRETHSGDRITIGILTGILAFFGLSVMSALAKLLTDNHSVVEIIFYRNAIPAIGLFLYFTLSRKKDLFRTSKPKTLFFRVVIGTCGLWLTFLAIDYLPLADATVLFFASTLIVPVLSIFLLKEHVGIYRAGAIIVGFCGVLIIAAPSGALNGLGVLIALGAALGHAVIQIFLRHLRSENPLTVTFYFMFGGALIAGCFMPWFATMPSPVDAALFLGLGISGGLAQIFLTRAFKLAPASIISPFNYTTLLWATGFDIMLWDHMPGAVTFMGAALIISSNMFILYREGRKKIKRYMTE